jgi:predicted acyl esterase
MAVSGWADGYSNTVFRLLEHLKVPVRGLVGPWGHKYPHMGGPGPAIDFLGECVRWWDQWLKGEDRGIDKDPMLRAWMLDRRDPQLPDVTGHWVAEAAWPSPRIEPVTYLLAGRRLQLDDGATPTEEAPLTVQSPLSVGLFGGKWCSYAETTDLPSDQRLEDGGALVFDSAPLPDGLDMLGAAEVELELAADRPVAMVAVRLSDVAPDDRATRVTYGVLNLTHRDSHEQPTPLEPGRRYRVRLTLNDVAQRFYPGHRIRLAVSSSYWPLAWPSPEPVRLSLYTAGCRLRLPWRPPHPDDGRLRDLGHPRQDPAPAHTLLAPAHREWQVIHNLARNQVTLDVVNNDPVLRLEDTGVAFGRDVEERYSYRNNRYATVRGEVVQQRHFERPGWQVRTETRTVLTSTADSFLIRATLDAYEGDVRLFSKSWDETVPRDLV